MNSNLLLCDRYEDAIVAYLVKSWNKESSIKLGRTLIQKLCYFAKEAGVPMHYDFDMHHYGPYCQELYHRMDDLIADSVVADKNSVGTEAHRPASSGYELAINAEELIARFADKLANDDQKLDSIARMFKGCKPSVMELLATVHFCRKVAKRFSGGDEERIHQKTVEMVLNEKEKKFEVYLIEEAYDAILRLEPFV